MLPVVRQLRDRAASEEGGKRIDPPAVEQRIVTTERELAIVNYVRRRLAFLVSEEMLFNAIERIDHKDYIGKLIVYYDRERKGQLFEFIEGSGRLRQVHLPRAATARSSPTTYLT